MLLTNEPYCKGVTILFIYIYIYEEIFSKTRSLLERPPPAPETRVRDPLGVMVRTRGGLTIIV